MSSEIVPPRAPAPSGSETDGPRRALGQGMRAVGTWGPRAVAAVGLPTALGEIAVLAHVARSYGGAWGPVLSVLVAWPFLLTLGGELLAWAAVATRGSSWSDRVLYLEPGALVLAGAAGVLAPSDGRLAYFGASAFLVLWLTYLLQFVYRHKQLDVATMRFVREATLLAVLGGLGWFLWALDAAPVAWAGTGLVAAAVLARAILARSRGALGEKVPWLLRPGWAVELLLYTFLAEFFVGALLDLEIAGPGFLQYIPFVPVAGGLLSTIAVTLYDGLWFGAAILASAWFLVAIGVTMGGLVVLRLREVHVPAQRYRMVLMLAVYALAAVYVPSLASSTPLVSSRVLANLPVIGWGFGLRSGGPFESGIFLAVLVMYASVGVLTVLFGRKALCAVMCGAAIMYQGTTTHEMRHFNQSSRVGRYFLGARMSTAYVVASSLALVSLFAVSLLAYLHRLPVVEVASGQYDTAALPLPIELYFGGLWFAMFVSTPYVGTYNCATTGICHWGSLSVPFAKVSLFRLRVKDRAVCQACTTFDCAKACPVGLVDMPVYFRTTGEYRSTKCCGVGDCAGACPYGNLYHQDARTRFTAWLGARLRGRPTGPLLPMASPRATGSASSGGTVRTEPLSPP